MHISENLLVFVMLLIWGVETHLTSDSNIDIAKLTKIEECCILADACVHDTVGVCGAKDGEFRTFMDLCDLLEYNCDKKTLYEHVEDKKDCPAPKEIKKAP